MDADTETSTEIEALIRETYRRMSTPGRSWCCSTRTSPSLDPDRASHDGPEPSGPPKRSRPTDPDQFRVWREGDVAWAQIVGHVVTRRDGVEEAVPYTTTGVFVRDEAGWHWRYWGGSEPQAEPKV